MADVKISALPASGALAAGDLFAVVNGGVTSKATVAQVQTAVTAGFVASTRLINTTSPLAGGGDLSADRTLTIADAVADGATKGAATFTAADFNSAAGVISIDYVNGQAASAVNKGFLTSADWSTFSANAPPFTDTNAIIKGSGDPTKLLRFEVDGFTAGATRVLTPPNLNCTIAGLQVSQTFSADQTFTPGNNVVPVTIGGNSVTGASTTTTLAVNTTWNTTGAPDAIQLIVTDTASDPASNLLDLMVGATSQFAVSKVGTVTQLGQLRITGAAALTSLIYASTNTTATGLTIFEQASADTDSYDLSFRKARGTVSVPTVITVGDVLGTIIFRGYGGASGYVTSSSIRATSTGTIADTRVASSLIFATGTDAAPTVLTDRWQITNAGHLFASSDNAYDIGASAANRPRNLFVGTSITAGTDITAGSGSAISWSTKTLITSATDGIVKFTKQAGTGFTRFNIGFGTTSGAGIGFDALNGITLQAADGSATWNDSSTAGSGTVASRYMFGIGTPTLTGTNTLLTYTIASSVFIGGAPVASTNVSIGTALSLYVAGGLSRFDGAVLAQGATAIPAGGTAGAGFRFSSTSNFGIFFGSGAPSLVAAKGSLYLRSDGTTTNDRAYIATDSAGAWTSITTAT